MGKVDLYQRELPKYEGRLVQAWHTYEIVFGFLELSEQKPKVDATLYCTLDPEQSQRLGYKTNFVFDENAFLVFPEFDPENPSEDYKKLSLEELTDLEQWKRIVIVSEDGIFTQSKRPHAGYFVESNHNQNTVDITLSLVHPSSHFSHFLMDKYQFELKLPHIRTPIEIYEVPNAELSFHEWPYKYHTEKGRSFLKKILPEEEHFRVDQLSPELVNRVVWNTLTAFLDPVRDYIISHYNLDPEGKKLSLSEIANEHNISRDSLKRRTKKTIRSLSGRSLSGRRTYHKLVRTLDAVT